MNPDTSRSNTMPKSVLVVSDQFLIGGRETFLRDISFLMREIGVENISLIAERVHNSSADTVFDETVSAGKDIARWFTLADPLIEKLSPQFIWAHHYGLIPALLLAERHSLPLHITLHGPPLSAGKYVDRDALAFSLAVLSGASISAVSNEIVQQISSFKNKIDCWGIFPNKVKLDKTLNNSQNGNPSRSKTNAKKNAKQIRFAVFSRQDKLEHLRQSVMFAHRFKRAGYSVQIDIYSGITEDHGLANTPLKNTQQIGWLFGRKWLIKNARLIPFLKCIKLHPLTDNVTGQMQNCDVVLGMGRVILESIVNGKVPVLVGYSDVIGVVNVDNFQQYQLTNFSGRAQAKNDIEAVVNETLVALYDRSTSSNDLAALANIESAESDLVSLMNHAANAPAIAFKNDRLKHQFIENTDVLEHDESPIPSSLLSTNEAQVFDALVGPQS